MSNPRIVIAGGTGFVGKALINEFKKDYEVVVFGRSLRPVAGARVVKWDGHNPGDWCSELEGAKAVINLTGEPINQRKSPEMVARVKSSRIDSTVILANAIEKSAIPPEVWINASAVGIYGDTGEKETSEGGHFGDPANLLVATCTAWEEAFSMRLLPSTRKAILRIGVVLGREGGMLPVVTSLARKFLGGRVGNGKQYISWIHQRDLARMMRWVIETGQEGTFNATAPNPVTNEVFMAQLRKAIRAPFSPPAPEWGVRLVLKLLGLDPVLLLEGQRAVPANALGRGFSFEFPTISGALRDLSRYS